MAHDCDISHAVKDAQERIFRISERRGLTLKAISLDSGIPYSTLRSYAGHSGATSEMPVSALRKLAGVVPDDLLSLLLTDDRAIVRVPVDLDLDDLSEAFRDFIDTKERAHHPESECGRDLGPNETATLNSKVVMLPLGRVA